ncbi:MAG: LysR family transcriptional regulator [Aquificae bacterium]|nr:LysR family transcriptional regulator [Aquificota bacterium]
MKLRYKVWFEKDGKPLLSSGKYELLKQIEKTGSIKRAAASLGIPYKKAHLYVKLLEERFGKPLFHRERGKGTTLTPEGRKLLETYERVLKAFDELAGRLEKLLPPDRD